MSLQWFRFLWKSSWLDLKFSHNIGMMKKQTNKEYSLLVYMKAQHKYTDSEVQLETLCKEKYHGRSVGGGTDLSTGKRDQQYVFDKEANAKAFLKHPFTKAVTLKDFDLVEVD